MKTHSIWGENEIAIGDCRDIMRRWIADGVRAQMCVTSPPYFGLRDYGHPDQIGLEQAPEAYVAKLVEVFRLVRDLLADDGVLWLNLGDSYAATTRDSGGKSDKQITNAGSFFADRRWRVPDGLKQKDLIGIPWRAAFALQADGWYLRQDIIWHKPNPMPESVRDRCTKAHEYLFLLAKSERYYFDSEAIAEPFADERKGNPKGGGRYVRDAFAYAGPNAQSGLQKGEWNSDGLKTARNRRSVWTVAPKPYKGAHFATFPPALIEPCILAGSRPGDVVLDPFMGSGTTAQVAEILGRRWLGCELNQAYAQLQDARLSSVLGK